MMLHLFVMRHAKSSWKDNTLTDHQRPLNPRGTRDAPRMGRAMARRNLWPELILCSDATRAQQTLQGLLPALLARHKTPHTIDVRHEPALYHAEVDTLRELIAKTPDSTRKLMIIGHNPGLDELLDYLCGDTHSLTTANIASLTCQIHTWAESIEQRGCWSLESLMRPKALDPEDDL